MLPYPAQHVLHQLIDRCSILYVVACESTQRTVIGAEHCLEGEWIACTNASNPRGFARGEHERETLTRRRGTAAAHRRAARRQIRCTPVAFGESDWKSV